VPVPVTEVSALAHPPRSGHSVSPAPEPDRHPEDPVTAGHSAATPARAGPSGSNGIGTTGFVTGLLGLVLFWVPIVGVVLGVMLIPVSSSAVPA
jgi:hypothetical protein